MAQALLEACQRRFFVAGFDIDHSIRSEPGRRQARRKQILVKHAPENLTLGARHDAGCEQSCRRAIQCAIAGAGDLMQGSQRQSAARQPHIHLRHPEWQDTG